MIWFIARSLLQILLKRRWWSLLIISCSIISERNYFISLVIGIPSFHFHYDSFQADDYNDNQEQESANGKDVSGERELMIVTPQIEWPPANHWVHSISQSASVNQDCSLQKEDHFYGHSNGHSMNACDCSEYIHWFSLQVNRCIRIKASVFGSHTQLHSLTLWIKGSFDAD